MCHPSTPQCYHIPSQGLFPLQTHRWLLPPATPSVLRDSRCSSLNPLGSHSYELNSYTSVREPKARPHAVPPPP